MLLSNLISIVTTKFLNILCMNVIRSIKNKKQRSKTLHEYMYLLNITNKVEVVIYTITQIFINQHYKSFLVSLILHINNYISNHIDVVVCITYNIK